METIVKITWDQPEDENWLNPYNIELAISAYCKNTRFQVEEVKEEGEPENDGINGVKKPC